MAKKIAKRHSFGNVICPFCEGITSSMTQLEVCTHCGVEFSLNKNGDWVFDDKKKTEKTAYKKLADAFSGMSVGKLPDPDNKD